MCVEPLIAAAPARIFVGIKVADVVAGELAELARPLGQQGVRLVSRSDIHLTLVPPWNEFDIAVAAETLRTAVGDFKSFLLRFVHVGYGPRLRDPHLLWVECAPSSELTDLRTALLAAYGKLDSRPFVPHVTLARLPRAGRRIVRQYPRDRAMSLTQSVASVELFQSPPLGQTGYHVLTSIPLGWRQTERSAHKPESSAGQNGSGGLEPATGQ